MATEMHRKGMNGDVHTALQEMTPIYSATCFRVRKQCAHACFLALSKCRIITIITHLDEADHSTRTAPGRYRHLIGGLNCPARDPQGRDTLPRQGALARRLLGALRYGQAHDRSPV